MADGFTELTVEKLKTEEGARELNRMLNDLYKQGRRCLLPYGDSAAVTGDAYASLIDGVVMTSSIGYRMHRSGSIVGHSCLVNITTATAGDVTFEVRVNDTVQAGLSLQFASALGTGVKSKNLKAARHEISFSEGDIVQVFQNETTTMEWTSVVGFIEVEFND